ncbi:MAG: DEAD/DEAH box helicase [Acidilobus sp.]
MRGLGAEPEDLLNFAISHGVHPWQVSAIARSLTSCPKDPVKISEVLASLGLYEDVVYLARRLNCPISSDAIKTSRAGLLGLAEPKWESEAAALINERPLLSGSSEVMSAVCVEGMVEVNVDGVVVTIPPKGTEWRSPPSDELVSRIASLSGAHVVLSWGCGLASAIDAKLLVEIAFPDSRPTIPVLAHSLGLSGLLSPSSLVIEIAKHAAFTLEEAGVDWSSLPREVRGARALILYKEPPRLLAEQGVIMVTDRPRAIIRTWRPFKVDLARAERSRDPLVLASLRSLQKRGGDPLRAMRNRGFLRHGERLSKAILDSLTVNRVLPTAGEQVEPWDVRCLQAPLGVEVSVDCIRPLRECLTSAPPHDESLVLERLGISCDNDVSLNVDDFLAVGKVKTGAVEPSGKSSLESVFSAIAAASEKVGRLLVIVPNWLLSSLLKEVVSRPAIDDDVWAMGGGTLVLTLDEVYSSPEYLQLADDVILLFPERYRGTRKAASNDVRGLVELAMERTRRLSAVAITRAWSPTDPMAEPVPLGSRPLTVRLDPDLLMDYARDVFKGLWGKGAVLRPYQEDALQLLFKIIADSRPSLEFVILPTGAGKSAIFQVASVVISDLGFGPTLVVSPLRALMHDQVRNAVRRGLAASYIDSTVSEARKADVVEAAVRGLLDLVYVTPEGVSAGNAKRLIEEEVPGLIVLDEAHALSRWGLSFRPSYLRLAEIVRGLRLREGWPPVLAMSASAPHDVISDVVAALGSDEFDELKVSLTHRRLEGVTYRGRPVVLRAPAIRPEIEVDVIPAQPDEGRLSVLRRVVGELSEWASSLGGPWVGIVFVPFVESKDNPWMNVDYVAGYLSSRLGVRVARYHGKMGDSERRYVEEALIRASHGSEDDPNIVVATKAFGMGVDIPNVRWTVHLIPSESVEDLYQEIGRAGRDGRPARAVILYNPRDINVRVSLAKSQSVRPSQVSATLAKLRAAARLFPRGSPVAVPIGDSGVDIRTLDVLRLSGLLDYDVVEGPLILNEGSCGSEEVVIRLKGGRCLTSGKGKPAALCLSGDKATYNLADNCDVVLSYRGPVALIYLEHRISNDDVLPPEAFALSLWMSRREVKKALDVKEALEQALSVKSRAGERAASEALKRLLDIKLSHGYDLPREIPKVGGVVTCESLRDCVERAAPTVHQLIDQLGESSVTVAASPAIAKVFIAKYVTRYGRAPPVSANAYGRLLRYARERRLDKIMDLGYVILVTKRGSRAEQLLGSLRRYPYLAAYLYGVRDEKGGGAP